jgi:hypothetical protein
MRMPAMRQVKGVPKAGSMRETNHGDQLKCGIGFE